MNNKYITIDVRDKEKDEIDTLGLLLQKYVPGTTYNENTKIWTVPDEIYNEIKNYKAE